MRQGASLERLVEQDYLQGPLILLRQKLAEQHCQRLEVQMDCGVIDKMSGIARFKKEPMWSAVQAALEAYVEEYDKLTVEGWRLQE